MRALYGLLLFLPAVLQAQDGAPRVVQIEARLWLEHSGTLSAPIKRDATLWNTIIGEGSAAEPSTATLVDVVVRGKPGSYTSGAKAQLTVLNARTGKVMAQLSRKLGVLSDAGVTHVAFWLPDTGCEPLSIKARVGGTIKKLSLPFACGE